MNQMIKRIREGDDKAFKELTISIQNDLYRVARTRLKDDDDIKDAIQNTMLITYNNISKIKNEESFKYWMIHVLINECNKIYNQNKKNSELFEKATKDNETFINPMYEVNSKLDFEKMLDILNYDEKIVITLYYNSQYTCSQIAKILNISVNTAKSRLTRGKEKLKKYYKEDL